jgi:AraC-like DNA-binding protein
VPFVRLLHRDPRVPVDVLKAFDAMDVDEHIQITTSHELLEGAIALTGDADIGLRAARETRAGDFGALEYAARSSESWGEAVLLVGRYMRLVHEGLIFSVTEEGENAFIQLESIVPQPRAATDFQSAVFFLCSSHMTGATTNDFEAWFMHEHPESTLEYERTFSRGKLRFGAPRTGFLVPRRYFDRPVRTADPNLHKLMRKQVDAMLAELPKAPSVTEQVRELLTQELNGGTATLKRIARRASMSERSLTRYLHEEGTTFRNLLEDLRRRMAVRYVQSTELSYSEIAFLLGYSDAAPFYRAFRRWTGRTPRALRHSSATLSPLRDRAF